MEETVNEITQHYDGALMVFAERFEKLAARVPTKWSKRVLRLWYYCGQMKNHRQIGGDFSIMVDPRRIELPNLSDANRTLSQLSYGPILPLFARFSEQKADF